MSYELITEEVNIYQYPTINPQHLIMPGSQITMGDLHANPLKVLYMLIKHGIAKNISEERFQKFVTLYSSLDECSSPLTKEIIATYKELLDSIEFNTDILVRLLGDEVGDRGPNDLLVLLLLEKLIDKGVPVEIMGSNHAIEFIEAYEKQKDFHPPRLTHGAGIATIERLQKLREKYTTSPTTFLKYCITETEQCLFARSLENLQYSIEKDIISREEVLHLINKAYKPCLKILSYSLSQDENKQKITLFSHAPINIQHIKNLAGHFHVVFQDATAQELANTIDNINEQYQLLVQQNKVHSLYTAEEMNLSVEQSDPELLNPFVFILWNRYHNFDRPKTHLSIEIAYANGHISTAPTEDNLYNLDNALGKGVGRNKGLYTVLFAQKGEFTLVNKPAIIESTQALSSAEHQFLFGQKVNFFSGSEQPDPTVKPDTISFIN